MQERDPSYTSKSSCISGGHCNNSADRTWAFVRSRDQIGIHIIGYDGSILGGPCFGKVLNDHHMQSHGSRECCK